MRRQRQIAFVLPVLVVRDDQRLALRERLNRFLDRAKRRLSPAADGPPAPGEASSPQCGWSWPRRESRNPSLRSASADLSRREPFLKELIDPGFQQFVDVSRKNVGLEIHGVTRSSVEQIGVLLSVLNKRHRKAAVVLVDDRQRHAVDAYWPLDDHVP